MKDNSLQSLRFTLLLSGFSASASDSVIPYQIATLTSDVELTGGILKTTLDNNRVLVTNNLKWRYRLIYGKIDSYDSTNIKKGDIAVYRLQQLFSDVKKIVQAVEIPRVAPIRHNLAHDKNWTEN